MLTRIHLFTYIRICNGFRLNFKNLLFNFRTRQSFNDSRLLVYRQFHFNIQILVDSQLFIDNQLLITSKLLLSTESSSSSTSS